MWFESLVATNKVMKKLIFAVLLALVPIVGYSQTKAITYVTLSPSQTGFGSGGLYGCWAGAGGATYLPTDAEVDSVWTSLLATGTIGGNFIYQASYNVGADTSALKAGRSQLTKTYGPQTSSLQQFQVAKYSPVVFSKTGIAVGGVASTTDTGITLIGTPAGNFVVTGIFLRTVDTAGYTSNATVKVGSNASSYNNLFATGSPTLGALATVTLTLVTPRTVVASGTGIYFYVTTGAVATSEHVNVAVVGYYE